MGHALLSAVLSTVLTLSPSLALPLTDDLGNCTSAQLGADSVEYRYDPFGRRIHKSVDGGLSTVDVRRPTHDAGFGAPLREAEACAGLIERRKPLGVLWLQASHLDRRTPRGSSLLALKRGRSD